MNRLYSAFCTVLPCLLFSAFGPQATVNAQESGVINGTRSLIITVPTAPPNRFTLRIRNTSSQPLRAFELAIPDASGTTEYRITEYFYPPSAPDVAPGEEFTTKSYTWPINNSGGPEGRVIFVRAALFADGSGEGDSSAITRMRSVRLARESMLARGLEVIRGIDLDTPGASGHGISMDNAVLRVEALHIGMTEDGGPPSDANALGALKNTKSEIANEIRQIAAVAHGLKDSGATNSDQIVSSMLRTLTQRYESAVNELRAEHSRQ